MPEEIQVQTVRKQNWFAKHKVLTVLGVLLLLGTIVGATSGDESNNLNTNISTNQNTIVPSKSVKKEEPSVPAEYKSALHKADTYANTMHMSKAGVYDQLTSEYGEKFSVEAAQYAIDNVKADWKKNALSKAKTYQESMSMSPAAIHDQLVSSNGEKFTAEEADYAVAHLND